MNIQIELAKLEDASAIRYLAEKTFLDTFAEFNTPEDVEEYVAKNFKLEKIITDIQTPDNQFVTLKYANELVAFVKLIKDHSTEGLDGKRVVEIEKFYVDKTFHGHQLGRKLMDFCVEWSIENNFEIGVIFKRKGLGNCLVV